MLNRNTPERLVLRILVLPGSEEATHFLADADVVLVSTSSFERGAEESEEALEGVLFADTVGVEAGVAVSAWEGHFFGGLYAFSLGRFFFLA